MFPILFQWGDFTLHTYGLLIAVGFVLGVQAAQKAMAGAGRSPDVIPQVTFPALIGGLLGARFAYVALHWSQFTGRYLEIVMVWRGGLTWFGGLLGGTFAAALWARKLKIPIILLADV